MTEIITQLSVGGIFALLVIREVLGFFARRRLSGLDAPTSGRRNTDKFKTIQSGVDAILGRLDRIVERLEDMRDATRHARKQSEITKEMTERVCRAVTQLEQTVGALARRSTDTQPGV